MLGFMISIFYHLWHHLWASLPSGGVWLCVPGPCHCPEAAAEEDPGRPRAARRGAVRAVRAVPRDEAAAAPRHPPDHPRPHCPQQCWHSQQVDKWNSSRKCVNNSIFQCQNSEQHLCWSILCSRSLHILSTFLPNQYLGKMHCYALLTTEQHDFNDKQ